MELIRLAGCADAGALAAIYDPSVTQRPTSFELIAPDAAQMAERVQAVGAQWPWLVAERDGAVTGYAYAGAFSERIAYQWSATVTVYVDEAAQRSGVGRRLYGVLFELLRRQGVYNAWAGITLPNDASLGLHRALGFEPVALYPRVGFKLGRWHDVGWYGLALLPTGPGEPPPPRPLPELLALGRLDDLLPQRSDG